MKVHLLKMWPIIGPKPSAGWRMKYTSCGRSLMRHRNVSSFGGYQKPSWYHKTVSNKWRLNWLFLQIVPSFHPSMKKSWRERVINVFFSELKEKKEVCRELKSAALVDFNVAVSVSLEASFKKQRLNPFIPCVFAFCKQRSFAETGSSCLCSSLTADRGGLGNYLDLPSFWACFFLLQNHSFSSFQW